MWDRFSLRLWAARFFFLFVLLFPKRRSRIAPTRHAAWAFASPWSEVVFQSDPPTTFAAFNAIIPIAEPTVRATVSPPFPPLRTGDHVLDREFGFALRII